MHDPWDVACEQCGTYGCDHEQYADALTERDYAAELEAHEAWLGTRAADHLFENGRGE